MKKNRFDYRWFGHIEFTYAISENVRIPSLLRCITEQLLRNIRYVFSKNKHFPEGASILFFSQSVNNDRTLKPITGFLKTKEWAFVRKKDFPISLINLYSIPYWLDFIRFYKKCNSSEQKRVRLKFQYFFNAPGTKKVFIEYFKRNKNIRTVVVANDHTIATRVFINVALGLDITVVYTQHASVSEKFPPLQFTYSFLDGKESYEKYLTVGDLKGKVILLGSPRFDEVMPKRQQIAHGMQDSIGIAMNALDSKEKVLELALFIKNKTGKNVIVRPHPRSMFSLDTTYFSAHGIEISDSGKESSYEFFTHICLLVANESGIHLDSAIFGIPSLLYNLSNNEVIDWYGYIRNGLIQRADSKEKVVELLKTITPPNDNIIQYYYAAFHTKYDGHIAQTLAAFLDATMIQGQEEKFIEEHFIESTPDVYII